MKLPYSGVAIDVVVNALEKPLCWGRFFIMRGRRVRRRPLADYRIVDISCFLDKTVLDLKAQLGADGGADKGLLAVLR